MCTSCLWTLAKPYKTPKYQDLIQPNDDSSYCFWAQKVQGQIRHFLACLYCQKPLKTKIVNENAMFFIIKSVLKECCTYKKACLLKQSIFVQTKYKTECKIPICLQYFLAFVVFQRFYKFISLSKFKSCFRPSVNQQFIVCFLIDDVKLI